MTKNEKLVAYIETTENARKSYIDSDFDSDNTEHEEIYIAGYVAHWRESLSEVERCVE